MQELEARNDGIYTRADWTPTGMDKLAGGEYRFLSPNFPIASLETLGGGKVRPHAISKAGLTNEPNLVGIAALTNRAGGVGLIGPACEIENRANIKPEKIGMDYKTELCKMLKIDPASDDAAIQAAVQAANDKAVELENQKKDAQAEQDMTDLEKEGASICNRADVKAGLIANREATLKAIRAVRVASLPNRADGKPPVELDANQKAAEQTKAIDAACLKNRCNRSQGYHFAAIENPALFAS
jgi:phage I-like protein